MAPGLFVALLVCLYAGASFSAADGATAGRSATAPTHDDAALGLTFSPNTVAVWTRAYVLQELEQSLQATAKRWHTIERQLATRHEATPSQLSAARVQLAAMLRDVRRERATQLRALQRLVGRAARLPRRIRSPEVALAPPWLPRTGEVDAAVSPAVRLDGPEPTLDPAAVDGPATPLGDEHVFTRLDGLIHFEIADTAPAAEPTQELQRQTTLASFYGRRRTSYLGVLAEAEQLRRDALAAWHSGALDTAHMLAAELESLSVEVAALQALYAYEAALARIQAILDRA